MTRPQTFSLWVKLCLTFAIVLLVGCAAPASPAPATATESTAAATAAPTTESLFPLAITDAAGQEFTFDAPPRMGCLWAGCYEMMADLGLQLYAATAAITNTFFSTASPPLHLIADGNNPEHWAAAEIDLLVVRVPPTPAHDALKSAAPIFYMHHPSYGDSPQSGYQAYIENLRIFGQLTGHPAEAAAAIARFEAMVDNLRAFATPETAELVVAVLFTGDGYSGLAPTNPFCALLAEVGLGQCTGVNAGEAWLEVNAEQFLEIDPDWIVYQTAGTGSYEDRTDPVWGELTAVKEGRVYNGGNRYYCCSARGLIHAFQEYVSHVLPETGIPDPGLQDDFDPRQSPLVQPLGASLFPLTITDAAGQEFTFDAPPQLGCLWLGCHEMLADMGLAPHASTLGDPEDRNLPYYVPVLPATHYIEDSGNPELWAATEVDLILTRGPVDTSNDALKAAAPIFYLHGFGSFELPGLEEYKANYRLMGQLTGQPEAAEAAITRFESALTTLRGLATEETRALHVSVLSNGEGYHVWGVGTPFCDVLELTGLGQCTGEGFWTEISAEAYLEFDPDWIVYLAFGDSYADRSDPVWTELTAVKEGRVYDAASNRMACCSLRGLYYPLQEYVSHILPEAGIPNPGPLADFDPAQSILVTP